MYHPESFPVWDLSVYLTSRDDIICYGQDRILNFIDVIFDEDTNAPNTLYLPNFDQPFLAEINGSKQVPYRLHSHKWQRQDFSLQYQYNIKQASNKNKEKYHKRIVN